MTIQVRLATSNDAGDLARLNFEFNGGERRQAADIARNLNRNKELVVVAVTQNEIVGFGCAQSYQSFCYPAANGEITEMYVTEAARRKGAAAALIAFLEQALKERGVDNVKILTGSLNNPAIRTYETSGYVKCSETVLMKHLG